MRAVGRPNRALRTHPLLGQDLPNPPGQAPSKGFQDALTNGVVAPLGTPRLTPRKSWRGRVGSPPQAQPSCLPARRRKTTVLKTVLNQRLAR